MKRALAGYDTYKIDDADYVTFVTTDGVISTVLDKSDTNRAMWQCKRAYVVNGHPVLGNRIYRIPVLDICHTH